MGCQQRIYISERKDSTPPASSEHLPTQPLPALSARVSEPACFGAAPAPEIFYLVPAPAPGKREHDFRIFEN